MTTIGLVRCSMGNKTLYTVIVVLLTLLLVVLACFPKQDVDQVSEVAGQVRVVVATTDLAIGFNRYTFGILDEKLPVRVPEVRATFLYLDVQPPEPRIQEIAKFISWPAGRAGVYVAHVSFDEVGRWGIVVEMQGEDGRLAMGQAEFVVNEKSSTPAIGHQVPFSLNKTVYSFKDLTEITTSPTPDPDLYQITIADAIVSGKPTVVTFATPAFCQTMTCGPQVDEVTNIKDLYKGRANFVHIEVYDNPKEMEGDFSKKRISPIVEEWGLVSEPFTFVIGVGGLVAAKFEGFATKQEIENALKEVLQY